MRAYAVAVVLAVIGIILIVSTCDDPTPSPTKQSVVHPAKRERPPQMPVGPKSVEIAGSSETDTAWNDPETGRMVRVRRTLVLTATPTVKEEGDRAIADILLDFKEGADVWNEGERGWRPMDENAFGRWFKNTPNRNRITYSATASITKVIDEATGEPRIESVSAFGTTRDDPRKDWSKVENGMGVYLDWTDDLLVVKWSSIGTLGVEPIERSVEIPFSSRFSALKQ